MTKPRQTENRDDRRRQGPLTDLLEELSDIANGYLNALRNLDTGRDARWQ